jgi:hypothetical protein
LVDYFAAGSIRNITEQLKAKKVAVHTHSFAVEELSEAERVVKEIKTLERQRKGLATVLSNLTKAEKVRGSELAQANADYVKARPAEFRVGAVDGREQLIIFVIIFHDFNIIIAV